MRKIGFILVLMLSFAFSCTKQKEAAISVTGVELDIEQATINKGSTIELIATVKPANATNKNVTWDSDNSSIASVDNNGVVTGLDNGTTTITVTTVDGKFTAECSVKVKSAPAPSVVNVTSVSLNKTEITIKDTESYQLEETVLPENATDKSVIWTSDNDEVAYVSSIGLVQGVDAGTANITVTTTDGSFKASCKVNVTSSGTHAPKRPSCAAGTNWTKTDVPGCEGMVLYNLNGNVNGTYRNVNVVDIDTSKYSLKYQFNGTRYVASTVLKNTKSLVVMNAAYETASIYIRIGGMTRTYIENNCIGTTGVANWKNDGCVCLDKNGKVCFLNTIFREADALGSGSYGLSLTAQRDFYRSAKNMGKFNDVYSSAPLMVFRYKNLGGSFVGGSGYYDKSNSEDPYYHQRMTHPRTVIAMDGQGHLLMITADGRQEKLSTKSTGYSCRDLTQLLVENFNPKYALNMDGGGSTTLCIAGMGNADNVVNHPIDDGKLDQERLVSSFFYVVRK